MGNYIQEVEDGGGIGGGLRRAQRRGDLHNQGRTCLGGDDWACHPDSYTLHRPNWRTRRAEDERPGLALAQRRNKRIDGFGRVLVSLRAWTIAAAPRGGRWTRSSGSLSPLLDIVVALLTVGKARRRPLSFAPIRQWRASDPITPLIPTNYRYRSHRDHPPPCTRPADAFNSPP